MRGPLRYPRWKALLGSAAGWSVWGACTGLLLLPDAKLAGVFRCVSRALRAVTGATPLVRSLDDLDFIFSHGGPHAENFRRLLSRSRPEEIATVVRGAVIRWLP